MFYFFINGGIDSMNKKIIMATFLILLFLLFISGCTSSDNVLQTTNDEDNALLSDSIQANETSIKYFPREGTILGTNCRIKVIDPLAREYVVDQPAPGMKIPLSLIRDNLSKKSDLRIQWFDENNNQKIDHNDMLELTTLLEGGLDSGDWFIKIVSKTKGEIVHQSDNINIP